LNKSTKKVRVNLDLPESAHSRLTSLQKRLEATNKSTVIRQALQLYEYFLDAFDEGGKVFVGPTRSESIEQQLFHFRQGKYGGKTR